MNNRKRDKIEVKYESNFEVYTNKAKQLLLSILKPIIAILIIGFSLYILGYVILIVIVFLLLLYVYNRIKNSINN
tara:strand:+ start:364 stop:588 length:225 start_codon:yes stop_codon:yes gene_type:complete